MIDWQDKLFGDFAHEWMLLLYEYEQLLKLDRLKNTRFQIPTLWAEYEKLFPKPFIDGIFDPKDFKSRDKGEPIPVESPSQPNINVLQSSTQNVEKEQPKSNRLPSMSLDELLDYGSKMESLAIARDFKGLWNSDWTPIFQTFEVQGIPLEMCLVPPGRFMMGSNGRENEKPVHLQTLTEPYWMGMHPITNAQWRMAVEKSDRTIKVPDWADWYKDSSKGNHPVVGVTWHQCIDFLKWLGAEWRLPTEPQWEYAARGLDNLVYPFGNDFKPDLVVYNENSNKSTAAVGGRPKGISWVGAQDMSGNVWEWTASAYINYPYKADDGRENISSVSSRALRGGSWFNSGFNARAAFRSLRNSFSRYNLIGFRCVCLPSL